MAQAQKCRLVFMGTPDFAARILQKLASWPHGDIVAVYTQPDRPAGRGHKLTPSPVKQLAQELALQVLQPVNFRQADDIQTLAAFEPDLLIVAAYGLILPQAVIDIPRIAPLNVHASLLPRYRGAAPIQRAIMENWQPGAQTGVSIMRMVKELDAGPVYVCASLSIEEHTAGSLHDALSDLGAESLITVLEDIRAGVAIASPQDENSVSYAAKMQKSDGLVLDWDRPAAAVHAQIRAVTPWPGARAVFFFNGQATPLELTLLPGKPLVSAGTGSPGQVFYNDGHLYVACSDGWYVLGAVKLQGRKFIQTSEFVNGYLRLSAHGLCGSAIPPPEN
ncbi:MAG: methionyl-tRNA formyltransferase [Desulfovibrio sp.]|nr:methionyl-tRNA formyltransferase [Desulfovibrio sp.]